MFCHLKYRRFHIDQLIELFIFFILFCYLILGLHWLILNILFCYFYLYINPKVLWDGFCCVGKAFEEIYQFDWKAKNVIDWLKVIIDKKDYYFWHLLSRSGKKGAKPSTFINFSFAKKMTRSRPKISAPAPDQILNRLRLQLKNLGSGRLRLRNTGLESTCHGRM